MGAEDVYTCISSVVGQGVTPGLVGENVVNAYSSQCRLAEKPAFRTFTLHEHQHLHTLPPQHAYLENAHISAPRVAGLRFQDDQQNAPESTQHF